MTISTRPPTSPFVLSIASILALGLGCATGSDELDDETTFASFGSGNEELDESDSEGVDATDESGATGDTTGESDTTGEAESTTSDESTSDATTSESTDDMPPDPCGNGAIDPGEDCDGVDLGGQDCVSQGFDMGQLGCNDDCTFDTAACEIIEEFCGDGIVNNGEQCEANMLGNATCQSAGFVYGTIGCNAQSCMYDTSGCQNVWIEDFEDGVVPPGWSSGGNANWSITGADKHAGSWGGRSGVIGHSQSSWAQVTVQFVQAGSVAFWHKISSEQNFDFGEFYVDGVLQSEWSGAGAWVQYSTNVAAGQHVLRWNYGKDGSVVAGSDAWFVDDVTLTGGYVP